MKKILVSILTRPGGRVQLLPKSALPAQWRFQSSPVLEDGCNPSMAAFCALLPGVSILTRPGGRVQQRRC